MRVTNASSYRNFTASVNEVHSRLNKSMNKISSGAAYEAAADNPLAYYEGKVIDGQYQDALGKSTLLTDIRNRIYQQELGARSIQGTLTGSDGVKVKVEEVLNATSSSGSTIATIRDDLLQKQQSMVNDLNAQYQDYYIYGGNDIATPPFTLTGGQTDAGVSTQTLTFSHKFPGEDTVTDIKFTFSKDTATGKYSFQLDDPNQWNKLKSAMSEQGRVDIGYGSINEQGTLLDTYTGGLNMLTSMTSDAVKNMNATEFKDKFLKALDDSAIGVTGQAAMAMDGYTKASDKAAARTEMDDILGEVLNDAANAGQNLGSVYSDLGNKYSILGDTEERLSTIQDSLKEQYTDKLGADPYEAIMEMYSNNYSYNAALKVGANLMGSSLFDFMK